MSLNAVIMMIVILGSVFGGFIVSSIHLTRVSNKTKYEED